MSRELHNLAQILPDCWELDRQSVTFTPSAATLVDIDQLQQLEAQERWGEAVELLGGEFLEGLALNHNPEFETWLLAEREHWRVRAEVVLRHVIEGHVRRGSYNDALYQAQRLLQLASWDEETHRQIMRFFAWTGQRGAALRQFEQCQRVLREELDVEPAEETITLYKQIQAGRLDLPPQLPAFLTNEKARRVFERPFFVGREHELAKLDRFLTTALSGQSQVIFVTGGPGRGKTALLNAFTQQAMEKHPNLLVASGKCNAYAGLGDPYLPYRDVMAMLTGDIEGRWDAGTITREHALRLWAAFSLVVPALLNHGPHLLDVFVPGSALLSRSIVVGQAHAPWLPQLQEHIKRYSKITKEVEQSHLFQQMTHVLCTVVQEQPLLLILDDIQWADAASIALLFHLGRYLADSDNRLLIACAYRPEEVALGRNGERHPLAKVLNEFQLTFGDVWVNLDQAEKSENRRFTDALLDIEANRLDEKFRTTLFNRTDGHPLFTIELLGTMQDRGDLIHDADGAWIEGPNLAWELLPVRVEAVIKERMARLDPDLRDVLTIASVEGERFTAQVIAAVANVPERVLLRQLSQNLERQHRLVREQEEVYASQKWISRYRFDHILFQDYLYHQLSRSERQLLHGDIAIALEELYGEQLDEMAVLLAHHFHQASNLKQAFHYYTLAAERATRLYESGEASKHYTRAIQLSEWLDPDISSLTRLYRGRGLASERLGTFDQAHHDHTTVLQIAQATAEHQIAWQALIDLGRLWASRNYDQTREHFEAALDLARSIDEPALLAGSLNWIGNWYANNDNCQRAVAYHQEALTIFQDVGDRQELAHTLDLLGIAHVLGGDLDQCVQFYDQAILLFRELDNRSRLASSLVGRANTVSMLVFLTLVPTIPAPDAHSDIKEALQIAGEIGLTSEKAWAHWAYGQLDIVNGRFGHALKILQSGLRIASEIGHHEYVVGSRFTLGMLYAELLAFEQAREQLEGVLTMAGELRHPQWVYMISGALAETYLMLDDLIAAQTCLEAVISSQTPMDTAGKRYCWVRWAELALAQADPALALEITERLIASAPGWSPGRIITFLWKLKAEALVAIGCTEKALPLLHSAIENAQVTGERFLLWRLYASLGRLYYIMVQQEEADKAFSVAQMLIDELAATIPDEALRHSFQQGAARSLRTRT